MAGSGERSVRIVAGPLPEVDDPDRPEAGDFGAVVRFEGRVRRLEAEREIDGLDYTAYSPMAERELQKIVDDVTGRFRVGKVIVEHGTGRIPVGAISLIVKVYAPHREEALRACGYLIDRLKETVPIWKEGFGRAASEER